MTNAQLKQHAIDLLKGLIAAALIAAANAGLAYLRLHMSDILVLFGQIGGAVAAIKFTRSS